MAEGGGNRQHPRNLQGVLRMAVEAGSASDGPAPPEPMTQEVSRARCRSTNYHEIYLNVWSLMLMFIFCCILKKHFLLSKFNIETLL